MPDVPADGALLKVEVAGICGTDVKMYASPPFAEPVIMGHENVGVIARAGREFVERHGVGEGDRVFVEHYVGCYHCAWCHAGEYRHCENTDWRTNPDARRYGYTSAEQPAAPVGRVRPVPVPALERGAAQGAGQRHPELAGIATPLSNGIEWALIDGGVGYDSTVLIEGPGQQGLSQTSPASRPAPRSIIVTGTSRDAARLELAKTLGADHTIDVQAEDPVERIRRSPAATASTWCSTAPPAPARPGAARHRRAQAPRGHDASSRARWPRSPTSRSRR